MVFAAFYFSDTMGPGVESGLSGFSEMRQEAISLTEGESTAANCEDFCIYFGDGAKGTCKLI